MDRRVRYQPSTDLCADWDVAQPYLEQALEGAADGSNIFDVMSALERRVAFLWVGERSAAVTVMEGDTYTLWLAGGAMDEIEAMWPDVENHARGLGAAKVVVFGRKGWARSFLQPAGFVHKWSILEKQL